MARQSAARASGEAKASGKQRLFFILIPPILILGLVAALLLLGDRSDGGPELDGDLCPVATHNIAARAVYLVDLQKPLDEGRRALAGKLLHGLTLELAGGTELRVFALTQDSAAPRRLLDRLCKPYDNADIAAEGAKDGGSDLRDCDNLPAQIPQHIRQSATRFCGRRDALGERLDRLAERQRIEPVPNAFLIEALEETSLEFAEMPPGPRLLYVFSDMMQHAPWYSHAELGWNGWSFGGFLERRQAQDEFVGPRPPAIAAANVTLFYTPRQGITSLPRAKAVHKNFWQDYFADAAGAQARFQEQPTMAAYQSASIMGQPAEIAATEQEREQERQEREEAEQQLAQMEQEQAEQERAEQERAQAEQERVEQERAEQQRIQAEQEQAALQEEARQQAAAQEREAQMAERRREREQLAQEEAARAEAAAEADAPEPAAEPPPAFAEPEPPPEEPSASEAPAPAVQVETPVLTEARPEEGPAEEAPLQEQPAAVAEQPEPPAAQQEAPAPAVAPESVAAADLPACGLRLKSAFLNTEDIYPGGHRVDYGSATIVASYVVNEQGETLDDQVTIDAERSSLSQSQNFDLFANAVRALIERWEFDFVESEDGACTKGQGLSSQFQFQFNRRR